MRVLFLGAASSIGRALAARFACDGATLFLAARDQSDVGRIADDLRVRTGTGVFTGTFDATDFQRHESFLRECVSVMGGLDGVVLCFGTLGDQEEIERSPREARQLLEENLDGAVSLLMIAANHLEAQQSGFIIVLGSVAGDRGRRSNYVYAAGKAGLEVFTQGLRARLSKASVHVLTIPE
jgi:decaprenylphospho-beta-D-erythro-pentofuranosid-2-ulose 2-reductase